MPGTKWGQRWGDPWGASRRRITALSARRLATEPGALALAWESALAARGVWHQVYRDGLRLATTRERFLVTAGLPGAAHVFEVLDVGPLSGDPGYDLAWATTPIPGDRVRLEWDRVADAAAYAVYWDAGGGTVSFATPLVVLPDRGAARQAWTSAALARGTYKFCVRARDAAGNESANATAQTVDLAPWPPPPAGLALAYDPETRQATLRWADPPGLLGLPGAKIRLYAGSLALSGEWDAGLGAWPEPEYGAPVAEIEPGVEEWTSEELSGPAACVFALRSFDGACEEQNGDCRVRLETGASGDERTARPPPATGVEAQALPGGKVRVAGLVPALAGRPGLAVPTGGRIWRHADREELLAGNGLVSTVDELAPCAAGWRFAWDSPALTDGQAYCFLFRAGSGEDGNPPWAPFSDADVVEAVADSSAPAAPANQAAAAVRGEEE